MTNNEFKKQNLDKRLKTNYKIDCSKPIIIMLDGRGFSKFTKQFKRPFDNLFIDMMNQTAIHIYKSFPGIKNIYVQSDEINIHIDAECFGGWMNGRIQKISSIIAGFASSYFTYLYFMNMGIQEEFEPIVFDCRVWNVDSNDDVKDWFVYRNVDCVRNSKQQFAQSYIPRKEIQFKNVDQQIQMVDDLKDIKWTNLPEGIKYGRLIKKVMREYHDNKYDIIYNRTVYDVIPFDINKLIL